MSWRLSETEGGSSINTTLAAGDVDLLYYKWKRSTARGQKAKMKLYETPKRHCVDIGTVIPSGNEEVLCVAGDERLEKLCTYIKMYV